MTVPVEEDSTAVLVVKALVGKLNLQTYLYNVFWSTVDTTIIKNNVRYVAWGFEQDVRVGFAQTHGE